MRTIDEISIGRDGDMFTLTIYHYEDALPTEPTSATFLIGLPDQFHAETQRTIGQWLTRAVDEQIVRPYYSVPDVWPFTESFTHDAQDETNPDLARDLERGK